MVTRWRDQNGNTIEVISVTETGDNKDGEWYVARFPSGRAIPSIGNERGWYRTMDELQDAGIDIASLKEVRRVLKWVWE